MEEVGPGVVEATEIIPAPVAPAVMEYPEAPDLKTDFYQELDALQDTVSFVYELGFRLNLLLRGINPDAEEMSIQYAERSTDTPNQRADLGLKHQALGVPRRINWRTAGLDPNEVQEAVDEEARTAEPYPGGRPGLPARQPGVVVPAPNENPKVSITPDNAPKNESATAISN